MREKIYMVLALVFFIPLLFLALQSPRETEAVGIFSPFGGRVISWLPNSPGCAAITTAISAATFGAVNVTIEELRVGPPNGGTFGILKINGITPPGLTTIYKNGNAYRIPGSKVLGNMIDICSVCGGGSGGGVLGKICGGVGDKVLDTICGTVADSCPIGKIIHKIGSARGF